MAIVDEFPATWEALQAEGVKETDALHWDSSMEALNRVRARLNLPPVIGTDSVQATMWETESALRAAKHENRP